jgi:hypothetical protein
MKIKTKKMPGFRIAGLMAGFLLCAMTGRAFHFSLKGVPPPPALLLPADGDSTYMAHPHFRWTDEPGTDRYEIQIAQDENFQTLEDSDSIPVPRYVPLDGLPPGDCRWRVRRKLSGGETGAWSEARRLTIAAPVNLYTVSTNDSIDVITNTIAAAVANTPAKLTFETGTYRVALPDDARLFYLNNVQDLVIDGQGSTVVFDNPNSGFSYLTSCENVLLRRFTVDYFTTNGIPTTHTAGTVVSVDPAGASFVFQPLENYLPPDDPVIRDATQRRWGCLMDTNTPGRLKYNVPNWFDFEPQVDSLGGNQYRLYLISNHVSRIASFEPGDTFVKSATWGEQVMFCMFSTNITYEQITSYAGGANHFIGHWNDGIHFLRCASRIKEGRLISNGCGGYVGAGYRTGFWIEECLTEGMFDDAVNCANKPLNICEKTAANVFIACQIYPAPLLTAGEHLTLYNPQSGQVNGTFEITNLEWLAGGTNKWKVTVSGDLGEVFPGSENWNTQLFIDERAHPYVYVRNSTFRNSRRFGCLFRAHGGVIEGNTFSGLSEAAVNGENGCTSFAEGFDCRNVRILNNTVADCGYSSTFLSQKRGAIELGIVAYYTNCTQTVHTGIEISGNTIYDWEGKGVSVENAQDVRIHSNTVVNLDSTNFYSGTGNYAVYLNRTDGSVVTGNDLRDGRPMDAAVYVEESTNCVVQDNLVSPGIPPLEIH